MKHIILLLALAMLTSCYFDAKPKTAIYDDREGLEIALKDFDKELFTEDELAIYVQALKFAFEEINTGSNLEWTGPEDTFGGEIFILNTDVVDGKKCKEFKQHVIHKEIKYIGVAKSCSLGTTWELQEVK